MHLLALTASNLLNFISLKCYLICILQTVVVCEIFYISHLILFRSTYFPEHFFNIWNVIFFSRGKKLLFVFQIIRWAVLVMD
jgi:hypothetical protein